MIQRYQQQLWALHREHSKIRTQQREVIHSRVQKIIDHPKTKQKKLEDFPAVNAYICDRFPDVDLSDLNIYICPAHVVHKNGWPQIGGCYIKDTSTILVKDEIKSPKKYGKFNKLMAETCQMEVDVEDVVVHEVIHAVSHRINRASCKFEHMEEEFVYCNCIDFYKKKGMTEDDIVDNNLLPFCINDIYSSRSNFQEIFKTAGLSFENIVNMKHKEYQRFCNTHASCLVLAIKAKAQEKGHQMIRLYKQYGDQMSMISEAPNAEDPISVRFASLEIDNADL